MIELSPREALGPLNATEEKHAPHKFRLHGDVGLLRKSRRVALLSDPKLAKENSNLIRRQVELILRTRATVVSRALLQNRSTIHESVLSQKGKLISVGLTQPVCFGCEPNLNILHLSAVSDELATDQAARAIALISDATIVIDGYDHPTISKVSWEALRLGRPLLILSTGEPGKLTTEASNLIEHGAILIEAELTAHYLTELLPEVSRDDFTAFSFRD